jgi:hypothetical protein
MFNDSLQHALIVEGWLEIKDFLESMKTSSGHFDNDFFFMQIKLIHFRYFNIWWAIIIKLETNYKISRPS